MGVVVMLPSGDKDVFAMRVAAHLQSLDPSVHFTSSPGAKAESWSLDSVAPSGMSVEVGPLPHGTVGARLLEATRAIVRNTLDYIEQRNCALIKAGAVGDALRATVSPAAAALIRRTEFATATVFMPATVAVYPAGAGPIMLAADPAPQPRAATYIVHPELDGPNWRPLTDGDAAFVSADGTGRVLPFRRPPGVEGELVTLFVNEAAYQEREIGFACYRSTVKAIL
jgi:hypothetical protein